MSYKVTSRPVSGSAIISGLLYLESLGIDPAPVERELDLDREALEHPLAMIEGEDALVFTRRVSELTSEPYVHVKAGMAAPLGTYYLLDYLIISAPTLGKGISRLGRFASLMHKGIGFDIGATGDGKILMQYVDKTGLMLPYEREFVLCSMVQRAQATTGIDSCVSALHLMETSHDPELLASIMPVPLVCEPSGFDGLVFDEEHWHAPSLHADLSLGMLIERMAINAMPTGMKLTEQVKAMIHENLSQMSLGVELAAKEIGMSARSLQRHLREDGTSYTELLEQVRQSVARRLIYNHDLSVADISEELGFQEQSSATRAFKRWFGTTPRQLRKQLLRRSDDDKP